MAIKGIKNIFFDLGVVLIDLDKKQCIKSFEEIGVKNVEQMIGSSFKSGLFFKLEEGLITPTEFRNEIRKLTNIKIKDEDIDRAWNNFLLDIPQSKLDLLRKLNKEYRVFMLSNTNEIHFDYMEKYSFGGENGFLMTDYFEKCYLSCRLHLSKPNKAIFEAVITDSGVVPGESLFLDDSELNLNTAQEMGFETYLVSEKEDFTALFVK